MAYQDLVKNFGSVRAYLREFAVYGLRSRDEYTGKSERTYDDNRRRIESWLGAYLTAKRSGDGKTLGLAIDTRLAGEDPFFKPWKSASFTDGDITLHFLLLDVLHTPMTIQEILDKIDQRLADFPESAMPEESTLRKKLREYEALGLVRSTRVGKTRLWQRAPEVSLNGWEDALHFFAEVSPCGVIGSFITDRLPQRQRSFAFKHHYITHTLDSDMLLRLFDCMGQRREAVVTISGKPTQHRAAIPSEKAEGTTVLRVVPLRLFISAQSGRQYCMAWHRSRKRILACRMDTILAVEPGDFAADFDFLRERLTQLTGHMWGVSTGNNRLEEVSFTVEFSRKEEHILQRLEREKRCGTVERLDETHARFTAQVWDTGELVPWIRTFICRITELHFSNAQLEKQFREDIAAMCALYNMGEVGE